MFPFTLAGPAFLIVFVIIAAAVLIAAVMMIQRGEAAAGARVLLTDPYEIAFLRGGPAEAAKVAVLTLIDRGLIVHETAQGEGTILRHAERAPRPRHPLEQAIMDRLAEPAAAAALIDPAVEAAAAKLLAPPLAARGLLREGSIIRIRLLWLAWGAVTLLLAARLIQAAARGQGNLLGLVMLWGGAAIAAMIIATKLPNAGATQAVAAVGALLERARQRLANARPGTMTAELALIAAAVGLWAVPQHLAPYAGALGIELTPRRKADDGGGGGGCGSSSGDGGSGCGGGGGCGGCGGG